MNMNKNIKIVSFGKALPKKVIKNSDLEKILSTSDEWIQQRSGIQERRWVSPGETTLTLAKEACEDALKKANLKADDIDCIVFACLVSDHVFPGTGCLLQQALGFSKPIPAIDIRNQCSAFLYSLSVANAWIKTGAYKRILIIGSEVHSKRMDLTPAGRDVAVLFGDGAGACIVEASDENVGVIDLHIASEGEFAGALIMSAPGSDFNFRENYKTAEEPGFYPHMEGRLVFKHAVERMTESISGLLAKNNLQNSNVDFVIAHQANMRINAMVLDQLKIPWEKTHHTIQKYGNTTAATIPLTMGEAVELGKIKRGDLVALVAFGAGFTWGSALVRY